MLGMWGIKLRIPPPLLAAHCFPWIGSSFLYLALSRIWWKWGFFQAMWIGIFSELDLFFFQSSLLSTFACSTSNFKFKKPGIFIFVSYEDVLKSITNWMPLEREWVLGISSLGEGINSWYIFCYRKDGQIDADELQRCLTQSGIAGAYKRKLMIWMNKHI